MFKCIEYSELFEKKHEYVIIDVRTSSEYNESTIPGAINIPLFTEEDREAIGYVYVNESVEKAKRMGIEAVSKRLPLIYDSIMMNYKKHGKIAFFCARGGMRSSSLSALLGSLGINCYRIKGGYKGYRDFINESLPQEVEKVNFIVIHGKTGVGKTKILKQLKERGYDILDLEGEANHRGSLLGSVGLGKPRSQKQFESYLFEDLKKRKGDFIFVEGESQRVGNIIIPNYLFKKMREGIHVFIEGDIELRTKNLIEDYIKGEEEEKELLQSIDMLRRYISEPRIVRYKNMINEKQYEAVCQELMLKYYDPLYINSSKKYDYTLNLNIKSIEEGCELLEQWFKHL